MANYKTLYKDLYFGVSALLTASEFQAPKSVLTEADTIIKMYKGKEGINSEIIAALADGLTDEEVGRKLEKSTRTIEGKVYNMCRLYHVKNRTQLVVKFLRNGWIK